MKAKFTLLAVLFLTMFFSSSAQWERVSSGNIFPEGDSLRAMGNYQSFYREGELILIGSFNTGIWRSTDGGASWKKSNTGIPDNGGGYNSITDIVKHKGAIYSNSRTQGILKSTDMGASWMLLGSNLPVQNWAQNSWLISTGSNLIAGFSDHRGIYRSADDGITWTESNTGLTSKVITALIVHNNKVFAGTEAGISVSTDNGANWTAVKDVASVKRFSVLEDGTLLAASNKGSNVFGPYGGIYRSTDGGESWHTVNGGLPGAFTTVNTIHTIANTAFTVAHEMNTSNGGVYMMKQGDTSWTSVMDNMEFQLMNLFGHDKSYLYMLGTEVYRRKLSDFGISAGGTVGTPLPLEPASGALLPDTNVTIRWNSVSGAVGYHLQVSEDSSFSGNFFFNDSTLADTSKHISGLNHGTIYYWRVRAVGQALLHTAKKPGKALLSAPGEWSAVSSFSTPEAPNSVAGSVGTFTLRLAPNPASDEFSLSYVLERDSFVRVVLLNSTGGEVQILCNELKLAGDQVVHASVRERSSGLYFVKLTSAGRSISIPLNIVH